MRGKALEYWREAEKRFGDQFPTDSRDFLELVDFSWTSGIGDAIKAAKSPDIPAYVRNYYRSLVQVNPSFFAPRIKGLLRRKYLLTRLYYYG